MTPARIRLDCTSTAGSAVNTGIQRVVRNVVSCSMSLQGPLRFESTAVVFDGHAFHAIGPRLDAGPEAARGRLRAAVRGAILEGRRHRILRDTVLHETAVGAVRRVAGDARWRLRGAQAAWRGAPGVDWRPGDWLVLLDSNWQADIRPALHRVRAAGASVCVVVYDLIHVRHPGFVSAGAAHLYRRWFARTVPLADRVMAISRTVLEDVQRYVAETGTGRPGQSYGWFHLGAEIGPPAGGRPPHEALRAFLAQDGGPLFLTVGTLEPRKDQASVLDAIDRAAAAGSDLRLLLIGRAGWDADALVARIAAHPDIGRRVLWLADASDADLALALRHARALVIASHAEGFGLPIVEALHAGVPVIASDLPVFREVGGAAARYFPAGDAAALAALMIDAAHASQPDFVRPALPTWDDAARSLLAPLLAAAQ